MAIEILENTLLKLLVRRGTDHDRKQIILTTGELGYATDTERLYIGNSTDAGGILVGNKWKGSTADLTTLAGVITGDYAYDTSTNTLNVLIAGTGSNASDWYTVADQLSAGDTTINIDGENKITVDTLSAGNFSHDALGDSIELDGSNRIALSGTVNIDQVAIRGTTDDRYLTLPQRIKINPVQDTVYSFPAGSPGNKDFLRSDANGGLSWAPAEVVETTVSPTTAQVIPVATIVPFASGALQIPYGWLECDGASYAGATYKDLSAVIGNAYGGDDVNFNVPNLVDKVLYGSFADYPVNSNLLGVLTGASTASILSATGMNYIIKSISGVTNPSLTVQKNLSCFVNSVDKTGVAFDPLSGNVVIERPAPGMVIFDSAAGNGSLDHQFTTPPGVTYMKFHVTGSGGTGGHRSGSAAATVIGNVSAAPGTVFTVNIAAGISYPNPNTDGAPSYICTSAGEIACSFGGCAGNAKSTNYPPGKGYYSNPGQGSLGNQPENLNGYVVLGGMGGVSTNESDEETLGASSYWGGAPAPGGGGASWDSKNVTHTGLGDGLVMFEWN